MLQLSVGLRWGRLYAFYVESSSSKYNKYYILPVNRIQCINGNILLINYSDLFLTFFSMEGGKKASPTSFCPVTSKNVGISL